jgi:hypothetical protein
MIHKSSPKVSGQDGYFYGNNSRSRSGNNVQEELNIYGDEADDDNSGLDPSSAKKSPIGYQEYNQILNNDIHKKSNDNFDLNKRVKTLNQDKLKQSIEKFDLIGSKSNLHDQTILQSKMYKDLETQNNKLRDDL